MSLFLVLLQFSDFCKIWPKRTKHQTGFWLSLITLPKPKAGLPLKVLLMEEKRTLAIGTWRRDAAQLWKPQQWFEQSVIYLNSSLAVDSSSVTSPRVFVIGNGLTSKPLERMKYSTCVRNIMHAQKKLRRCNAIFVNCFRLCRRHYSVNSGRIFTEFKRLILLVCTHILLEWSQQHSISTLAEGNHSESI